MDFKTFSFIFGGCWVLGFLGGLFLAENKPSQAIDTRVKAIDYFNYRHSVEGDSVCLKFCGEILGYNAIRPNNVSNSPDIHYSKQKKNFSFTAVSAAGTLALFNLIGFKTPTIKEILLATENNIGYKLLALAGVGLGVGIGYYVKDKEDICDCKNDSLKNFLKEPNNWKSYAPVKGVPIDVNALPVRITRKLPNLK